MSAVRVAVLGSGNIGTDLVVKLLRLEGIEVGLVAGVDAASSGLARARELGVATSAEGVDAILADDDVRIVFDATSAYAHRDHAPRLLEAGKRIVDLTPAALGPLVVPAVNLDEHLGEDDVNMITCGGQATIPMVRAVHRAAPVRYAEMVSTIASLSAGPGTRQNIDEFTATTARALERVGGAPRGKAIIVLNPADPPILMRNTVFLEPVDDAVDEAAVRRSVEEMVAEVARYVPGYRLKGLDFDERVISVLIEVEGAGDFLPPYAGNLDIMTAAACRVGEKLAEQMEGAPA